MRRARTLAIFVGWLASAAVVALFYGWLSLVVIVLAAGYYASQWDRWTPSDRTVGSKDKRQPEQLATPGVEKVHAQLGVGGEAQDAGRPKNAPREAPRVPLYVRVPLFHMWRDQNQE